jgi:Cupin
VTGTSSASCAPGPSAGPAATAPPPSSSPWPSASRASSWTGCSTPGCSPPASRPWPRPRRRARSRRLPRPPRPPRGRRRQRPACSSAARPERPGDGDRSSGGGRVVPDAGGGGGAGVVGGGPHRLHAPAPSSAEGHTGRMDATEAWPPPDPVGEARHFLRMDGAFYCRSELRAPWGMTLHPMPGYLWFHVVTTGVLLLEVDQEHARWLHPGDVALGSRGNGHVLRSEPDVSALGILELALEHPSDRYEILRHGGGGAPTTPPRPQDRGRHRGRAVRPARLPVRGRARARLQTRHRRPPRRRQTRPRTAAGRGRRR